MMRRRPIKSLRRYWVVLFLGVFFVLTPFPVAAKETPLLTVTKRVVWEAAKIGLEEAGTRIMGPTAWRYLKTVVTPVYDELQNRFPTLQSKDASEAAVAAQKAVTELSNNKSLQQMLNDGFARLEEGQIIIIAELNRMDKVLSNLGKEVTETHVILQEILDTLKGDRERTPTTQLREINELAEVRKKTYYKNMPLGAREIMEHVYLQQMHIREILDNGEPNKNYSYVTPWVLVDNWAPVNEPTRYLIRATGQFEVNGQKCRDVRRRYVRDGEIYPVRLYTEWGVSDKDLITGALTEGHQTETYCWIRGEWKGVSYHE